MPGLTTAGQQATLDYIMTQAPYVALTTTTPTDAAAGTETTFTGYARKQTVAADWNAPTAASPSVKSNVRTVTFAPCTGGATQTVTHFELWTAATGGTRWAFGALASPIAVSNGVSVTFDPGQLYGTMD